MYSLADQERRQLSRPQAKGYWPVGGWEKRGWSWSGLRLLTSG